MRVHTSARRLRCFLQVMEEGEKLSTKQAEMEATMKKLRSQIKDLETDRDKLSSKLQHEEQAHEAMKRAKAKLERDLSAAEEAAQQELEATRQQAEATLAKVKAELVSVCPISSHFVHTSLTSLQTCMTMSHEPNSD